MSTQDTLGTRLTRIALMFSTLIFLFALWANRQWAFTDFRVLHFGSQLVKDGQADIAYDPVAFAEATNRHEQLSQTARELDTFWSTPTFALVMRPFALLSSNAALIVWLALGVIAVFAAVRILKLPAWAGAVALAMPFGGGNILTAQTGFFGLLWAAAIHRLCVDDKPVYAGLVAGLAVLKPTLLLGVAIWWLLDWKRWYPALLSALGLGTTLVAISTIGGIGNWQEFLGALESRGEINQFVIKNQPTLAEIGNRLVGPDIAEHPIAFALYLALGAVVIQMVRKRWPERTDVISGAAVLVSVLVSPHLLGYDAGLILVPFAVAVHAGVPHAMLERLMAIYVVTSLMMILGFGPFGAITDYTSPSTIGLIVILAMWVPLVTTGHGTVSSIDPRGTVEDDPLEELPFAA